MLLAIDRADNGEKQTAMLGIRMEPSTLAELEKICNNMGVTRTALVKKLIRDFVKENRQNE